MKGWISSVLAGALGLAGCGAQLKVDLDQALGPLPGETPVPAANPMTPERVALGRALFWDPLLSGNRDLACATCHHPAHAYADGRALSVGVGGQGLGPDRTANAGAPHLARRNALTLLDTAYNGLGVRDPVPRPEDAPMFWDERVASLEAQALGPLANADEMRGTRLTEAEIFPELVKRLTENEEYRSLFGQAFGPGPVTIERAAMAIAAFERTLVDRGTSFDRFLRGDDTALDFAQKRGLTEFIKRGCAKCHSGPMLSDFRLHQLRPGAEGRVRTPSLRHVTSTAPYLHDGSRPTLGEVFDFYVDLDTTLDPDLDELDGPRDPGARSDLEAFLRSLGDGVFDRSIPSRVPSGLPPAGLR